ncbi:hypothetical protein IWQ57_007029, partial [Coemansia nantahalensis]
LGVQAQRQHHTAHCCRHPPAPGAPGLAALQALQEAPRPDPRDDPVQQQRVRDWRPGLHSRVRQRVPVQQGAPRQPDQDQGQLPPGQRQRQQPRRVHGL